MQSATLRQAFLPGLRARKPLLLALMLASLAVAAACSSGGSEPEETPTPVGPGHVPVENPDGTGRPDSPVLTGDARRGLDSYVANGCSTCHSGEDLSLGPSHVDVFELAANRVEGLSAEQYLAQSIREPDAFIVPGYPSPSTMPDFSHLTAEEVGHLITFLGTIVPEDDSPPVISVGSLPSGNAEEGRRLYGTIGCSGCHSLGTDRIIGPGFVGVADRAGARKPGLSADEYIVESILNPGTFIVPGFPRQMPAFDELSPQQIADLLAFLKTVR